MHRDESHCHVTENVCNIPTLKQPVKTKKKNRRLYIVNSKAKQNHKILNTKEIPK